MCVNGDMKYTCACNSSGWTGSLCKTGDMSTFLYVAPFSVFFCVFIDKVRKVGNTFEMKCHDSVTSDMDREAKIAYRESFSIANR